MQSISTTAQYFIVSSAFPGAFIAVITQGIYNLTLATTDIPSVSPEIRWHFTVAPNASEWNICTNDLGANLLCMDQWGNNASQPALQPAGYYSGQQWTLTGTSGGDDGGIGNGDTLWRLRSDFAGPDSYLTGFGVGLQTLAMEIDAPEQDTLWRLVEINTGSASTSTTTSTTTPVPSTTPASTAPNSIPSTSIVTTSATGSAMGSTPPTSSKSTLTTGAKVGIAIGCAGLVLLVIIALLLRRNKRKPQQQEIPPSAANHLSRELPADPNLHQQSPEKIVDTTVQQQRPGYGYGYGQLVHEIGTDTGANAYRLRTELE